MSSDSETERAVGPDPRDQAFRIGARVSCDDGSCGKLVRVIVDPVARALTHIVVAPRRHHGFGKLVPIALVKTGGERVRLRCTTAEFERLDDAEEMHFLPYEHTLGGYGSGDALAWPYYGLTAGALSAGNAEAGGVLRDAGLTSQSAVSDRVPLGEVEVRRGDEVRASDGPIGSVQGLVIDPEDHHVTHVLLQEGHLWGRRQVAVPIGTVTRHAGVIQLTLTKQQVDRLAPVQLSRR